MTSVFLRGYSAKINPLKIKTQILLWFPYLFPLEVV